MEVKKYFLLTLCVNQKIIIFVVKITFRDKRLEKLANNQRAMVRALGTIRAKKFRLRLQQLKFSDNLEEVRFMSGNCHELKGDRKGQWACDLDQPYRLIFAPLEVPIPTNVAGQYIWIEILGLEIIEITNYH